MRTPEARRPKRGGDHIAASRSATAETPASALTSHDRSRSYDIIRATGALSVVFVHASLLAPTPLGRVSEYVDRLSVAVPMFFTLSGYLLYRPYCRARLSGQSVALRGYLTRRVLRLVPAYWFALSVLTVYPGLWGVTHRPVVFYALLEQYVPNMTGSACIYGCGLPPTWTLSVEWSFYLTLPVFAWLMLRVLRRRPAVFTHVMTLLALGATSVLLTVLSYRHGAPGPFSATIGSNIFGTLVWFVPGMLIAVVEVHVSGPHGAVGAGLPRWARRFTRPIIAYPIAGVLFLALAQLGGIGYSTASSTASVVANEVGSAVIAGLILFPCALADRPLGEGRVWGPLVWIGQVSYGVYLWHFPIQYELVRMGAWHWSSHPKIFVALLFLASMAIAIGCAAISYYAIELPCMALARRLSRPGRPAWSSGLGRQCALVVAAAVAAVAVALSFGGDPTGRPRNVHPATWNVRFRYPTLLAASPFPPAAPNYAVFLLGDLQITVSRHEVHGSPARIAFYQASQQRQFVRGMAAVDLTQVHSRRVNAHGIQEQISTYFQPGVEMRVSDAEFAVGHWAYSVACTAATPALSFLNHACQQVWSSIEPVRAG